MRFGKCLFPADENSFNLILLDGMRTDEGTSCLLWGR